MIHLGKRKLYTLGSSNKDFEIWIQKPGLSYFVKQDLSDKARLNDWSAVI